MGVAAKSLHAVLAKMNFPHLIHIIDDKAVFRIVFVAVIAFHDDVPPWP
jgi:hypothetical protein